MKRPSLMPIVDRTGLATPWRRSVMTCGIVLAAALLLFTAGCNDPLWLSYRDDPYMAEASQKNLGDILRNVNSSNKDDRQMALRIIASKSGEFRRAGRLEEARELEDIIIRRYFIEKEPEVRACIVRMCAPAVGRGSTRMVKFLRDRIAAGEYPGYAALSLAALRPKNVFDDIEPLTRHPAPEVRLQAAEALTVLADPRGYEPVLKVWRGMDKSFWPDKIDGIPLQEARDSLKSRAERGFGRPFVEEAKR